MEMRPIVVVKIGGSVLTCTREDVPDLNDEALAALLPDLRLDDSAIVLVHGSGAFGKPPAVRFGYLGGKLGVKDIGVVDAVSGDLEWLHSGLLRRLRRHNLNPVTFNVSGLFAWRDRGVSLLGCNAVLESCRRGQLPVIGSGFVHDLDEGGFAICSSDAMAACLAVALEARALVFATDVEGVYADYPACRRIHASLSADDAGALARIKPSAGDVTGGMAEKLRYGFHAANHGVETYVVDGRVPGNLAATLGGEPLSGTRLLRRENSGDAIRDPAYSDHQISAYLS